ncbi:uncharacterized protein LOC122510109 [Leptopilina heterotoma]|uniref:uncharacterized protein LOC122510109 n=1 Tax=Leptopilina heterotoma TaxID=63436 RepID=UPI001CA9147D|nr:uncharacterized protein LOC122510109 [Leptopilina heterotoma]
MSKVTFQLICLLISIKNCIFLPTNKHMKETMYKLAEAELSKFPVIMMEIPMKVDINNPLLKGLLEKEAEKYKKYYEKSYEPLITNIRSIKHLIKIQSEFIFHVTFGASNCTKGLKEHCVLIPNGENDECIIDAYSLFRSTDNKNYRVFLYCTQDVLKEYQKSPVNLLKIQPYVFSPIVLRRWSLR